MKNVQETQSVPLLQLLTSDTKPYLPLMSRIFASQDEMEKSQLTEQLKSSLDDKIKMELAHYGAEVPMGTIEMEMSLGSLLYDAYVLAKQVPSAPLLRMAHQNSLLEIASELSGDNLVMRDDVKEVVRKVLSDEDLWKSLKPTVTFKKDGKTESLPLIADSVYAFKQVLNGLFKAFEN